MSRLLLGTVCGLVYGALSAASVLPLTFADRRAATLGAFLNRPESLSTVNHAIPGANPATFATLDGDGRPAFYVAPPQGRARGGRLHVRRRAKLEKAARFLCRVGRGPRHMYFHSLPTFTC